MKKIVIFVLILILGLTGLSLSYQKDITSQNPIKLLDGSLEYDFMKQGDKNASKELYNFVLKDLNMTPKQIEDFANITPKMVNAFYVDLNDDGVKEIIGFVASSFYSGTAGDSLFILQKDKKAYSDIAFLVSFVPRDKFFVNKLKYNGYRTLKFRGGPAYKFKILGAGFDDALYQLYDWKKLHKKALQNYPNNLIP